MKMPRQVYTEELKQAAVKMVIESGLSMAEAGRRLEIPSMTLKHWVNKIKKGHTVIGLSKESVSELEAENSKLRKELAESRLECEIIKKAMAYYAKESLPGTRR